jgi:hypothetical protein
MKQVLNIPPMFLDSLHDHAPKRNAIYLELYNVAKSVDPKILHENRPQSSDSASTNLSGTSDQSKAENATDKLASNCHSTGYVGGTPGGLVGT